MNWRQLKQHVDLERSLAIKCPIHHHHHHHHQHYHYLFYDHFTCHLIYVSIKLIIKQIRNFYSLFNISFQIMKYTNDTYLMIQIDIHPINYPICMKVGLVYSDTQTEASIYIQLTNLNRILS